MLPIRVKHLILHPGSPKTGTTTLQNFLFRHREKLLDLGYLYPTTGIPKSDGTAKGHHSLALLLNTMDSSNRPQIEQICNTLRAELSQFPDATVILSSEEFFPAKRVQALKSILIAERCTCYVALRPQHELLNANYYTQVSYNSYRHTVEDFLKVTIPNVNYLWVLNSLAGFSPKTQIFLRLFEKNQLVRSNPVHDFLETLGINLPYDPKENVVEHPTLPAQATLFLRLINEFEYSAESYYEVFSNLHRLRRTFDPEIFTINPTRISEIIEQFAHENAEVRFKYGDGQVGDLFSPARIPDQDAWNRAIGPDPREVELAVMMKLIELAAHQSC